MIKAPEDYDVTQGFNDMLFLGKRLKALEDLTDGLFDLFTEVAEELRGVDKKSFRYLLKRVWHLEGANKRRSSMSIEKTLRVLDERLTGLESYVSTFSEIRTVLDEHLKKEEIIFKED